MTGFNSKRSLNSRQGRLGVSLMALAVALCAPLAAQAEGGVPSDTPVADPTHPGAEDPDPASSDTRPSRDNEVIVTGKSVVSEGAFSGRSAISIKQDSPMIMDSVGPELLGLVPDLDLVESAMRIPGVSGEVNIVSGNTGNKSNGIAIRGFASYNNLATVDGVPLATINQSTRGDPSLIFPTSLVQRIDVLKTFSADRDPHGLGGQIDYVTKSAFDYEKTSFLYVQAGGGLNTKSGEELWAREPSERAAIIGGGRFGSDHQFGIVLDAEYQRVITATSAEVNGGITYYEKNGTTATPYAQLSGFGNNLGVESYSDYGADLRTTKAGASLKLEYRGDRLSLSAMGGYYDYTNFQNSAYTAVYSRGNVTNITPTEVDFTEGQINQSDLNLPIDYRNTLSLIKAQYDFSSKLRLDVVGSYSAADSSVNQIISNWSRDASVNSALTWKINNGVPRAYFTDLADINDIATYNQANSYIMPQDQSLTDTDVLFGRAQLSWNAAPKDRGLGLSVGGTITRTNLDYNLEFQKYEINNVADSDGVVTSLLYPGTVPSVTAPGVLQFRTDPNLTAQYLYQNLSLYHQDASWDAENEGQDFKESETIGAFYAQGQYQTGRFSLLAGVRYDHTAVDVNTMMPAPAGSQSAYVPAPARDGGYAYWLPSALATYNISDQTRVRAAFSETIGRPSYQYLAGLTTYTVPTDPDSGGYLTISKGNENLKPLQALNYDLSWEWFSPDWGSASLAYFYKAEKNVIYTSTTLAPSTTYAGVLYQNVQITEPENAQTGYSTGVELAYTKENFGLPWVLNGLGMIANFTWLKGSFKLPMSATAVTYGEPAVRDTSGQPNQPDYIGNLALIYNRGPVHGLVSFQRTGKFLYSASSTATMLDIYYMPRNQLDATLAYDLRSWLTLSLQAQNITDSAFDSQEGPNASWHYRTATTGANYWLLLDLQF